MRHVPLRAWAALALLLAAVPVFASSPVPVIIGSSRDGALNDLQRKVDKLIGAGRLDVRTDFIGARPGDPDPWFWPNQGSTFVALTLIDRKSPHGSIGWYDQSLGQPVTSGARGGAVLDDWRQRGTRVVFCIPASVTRYGFYVDYEGDDPRDGAGRYRYYTDRTFNDIGPRGRGPVHTPYDGDAQMLVYDVSRWLGSNTWLVACEYSDSGDPIGHGDGESDNDFADILFTVSPLFTTPTQLSSFGQVKARFR
jgi:hypothetical protein